MGACGRDDGSLLQLIHQYLGTFARLALEQGQRHRQIGLGKERNIVTLVKEPHSPAQIAFARQRQRVENSAAFVAILTRVDQLIVEPVPEKRYRLAKRGVIHGKACFTRRHHGLHRIGGERGIATLLRPPTPAAVEVLCLIQPLQTSSHLLRQLLCKVWPLYVQRAEGAVCDDVG